MAQLHFPCRRFDLVGLLLASLAGTAHGATLHHGEELHGLSATSRNGERGPAPGSPVTLSFNAFSRDFLIELEPNARLARLQTKLGVPVESGAYRGRLADRTGSWVRLVLTQNGPAGLIFDGDTLFGIEVDGDSVMSVSRNPTMFRLADVYFAPGELACESAPAAANGAMALAVMVEEFVALRAAGATLNLNLGAVADFEFSQAFGANAQAALLTRVNNVDGIFSEQLGVQITAAQIDIFTNDSDPFTATAAASLLDEVANYRGATPTQDAQGLTHLFTGRDLDGTTAGIAFLGSVCAQRSRFDTRSFGAGLSESRRGATVDSLVAAHEIGHNFGAPHDAEAGSACSTTPATFLMAPSVNSSNQFSSCSIQQMQPEIAAATCLEPIGGINVAVSLPSTQQALVGVPFTHTAMLTSLGAQSANDVAFGATAQAGLEFTGADAGGAVCAVAPATVSCTIGVLASGAARSVALTMQATQVGLFALTASVTASEDSVAGDNNATITVAAVPVVDLAMMGTGTEIVVDQQTTINVTLENRADFTATAVGLTAATSAVLRPDRASLGGQPCTVTGQTVVCPPQSLAPHSTLTLALTATGVIVGSAQVSFSATASEAERSATDNQLALTVNVRAAAGTEEDGGGGALPAWSVAALLAAWLGRRRMAPR